MSIRRKFFIFVGTLVVAPVILLWAVFQLAIFPAIKDTKSIGSSITELNSQFGTARNEARDRFENAMTEAYKFGLANIGANIDGQLDSLEKSLLLSKQREDLVSLLSTNPPNSNQKEPVIRYFRGLIETHDLIACSLVDAYGRTILNVDAHSSQETETASLPSRSARTQTWFHRALRDPSATSWHVYNRSEDYTTKRDQVVSAAIAITDSTGNQELGFLQMLLPVPSLATVIRGPKELVTSIRLTDRQGKVVWINNGKSFEPDNDDSIHISQSIRDGLLRAEVSLPRTAVVANLAPFDNVSDSIEQNLGLVESRNAALEKKLGRMRLVMFATKFALIILAFGILWLLLGGIASRIELLDKSARRIREGDLDTEVTNKNAPDELGTLARGIDRMRVRLKTQIEELDLKVEERTAALAKANERLESEIEERRKAEAAALDASNAKSEFLATTSHEIRTPLSGIVGGVNLLANSSLTEDQKTICDIISQSTETLTALVNDILDLSKIEARKVELESKPFNVSSAIRDVCNTLRFRAEEKQLDLRFEDRLEDSLFRVGDHNRFKQIVYNLAGNAVKFTPSGNVTIRLSTDPQNYEIIRITISDTGIGMSQEQLTRIFEPFTQAKRSISENYGGTGLGLAISVRLAEQMGGSIEVDSVLNKGSTFTLKLPLPFASSMRNSNPPTSTRSDSVSTHSPKQHSILLAEDNDSNRLILSRILSEAGFFVKPASNGKHCLEEALHQDFDLIVMDCNMPVLDGCSATRAIREQKSGTHQPAILGLTAQATTEQQKRCIDAGMDDVLFKPVSSPVLIQSCKRLVTQS